VEIWQDPQVRRLALKWADGDPELAEDIRQTAYSRVAAVKHPERIEDLPAYFAQTLKHESFRLYAAGRETPAEIADVSADAARPRLAICGPAPPRSVDDTVATSLLSRQLVRRLGSRHTCLRAAVAARSSDPDRYRDVICSVSERVLLDSLNGEASDAALNGSLLAVYPEYFGEIGTAANALHQRFRRAREDVKALLRRIVTRQELA
jgi:hypothetical protein